MQAHHEGRVEVIEVRVRISHRCRVHDTDSSSACSEAYVIFSGGMPYDQAGRTPSITVVHSKTTTVLEMEHNVIDFITLCESPYVNGKYVLITCVLFYTRR